MSGGIDSTVAAFLLSKKYQIFGLTMRLGKFGEQAIEKAKKACKKLKIPHYIVNLEKKFTKEIIRPFCCEYLNGKTPNPCVRCNEKIKFGLLLKEAKKFGADYLVTGHYARLKRRENPNSKSKIIYQLLKARDKTRDQSYFLYRLNQNQLKQVIFPLGDLTKNEVKKIAAKNGLTNRKQKESREICFIPDSDYRQFLKKYSQQKIKIGPVKDLKGNILGKHQGISHYTVGQRKNLNISGLKEPYYVLKIDAKRNVIIVGPKKFSYSKKVKIKNVNWIIQPKMIKKKIIEAKIRYGTPPAKCRIFLKNKIAVLNFIKPQFAVTPGQSAVFYDKEEVLGGGTIEE